MPGFQAGSRLQSSPGGPLPLLSALGQGLNRLEGGRRPAGQLRPGEGGQRPLVRHEQLGELPFGGLELADALVEGDVLRGDRLEGEHELLPAHGHGVGHERLGRAEDVGVGPVSTPARPRAGAAASLVRRSSSDRTAHLGGVVLVVELVRDAAEECLAQHLALVGLGQDLLEGVVGTEDRDQRRGALAARTGVGAPAGLGTPVRVESVWESVSVIAATLAPGPRRMLVRPVAGRTAGPSVMCLGPMATVLMPIPARDFDPTEVAVTWEVLSGAGHRVLFTTPSGQPGAADDLMVTGRGLDPWGLVPGLRRLTLVGRFLRADAAARAAYAALQSDDGFPRAAALGSGPAQRVRRAVLPGGHRARGMRDYLESPEVQQMAVDAFTAGKPVGAICHGVLVGGPGARPGDRALRAARPQSRRP